MSDACHLHSAIDGSPATILLTNHAIRGVLVPTGRSTLVFRYQSRAFAVGVAAMGVSLACLAAWSGWLLAARRRDAGSPR